jgi:hypothetical protein
MSKKKKKNMDWQTITTFYSSFDGGHGHPIKEKKKKEKNI